MPKIPSTFPALVLGSFLLLWASSSRSLATDIAPTTSNSTSYSPPIFDNDPLTITAPISAWNNNVVLSGTISGNWDVYVNGVAPITFAGSNTFAGTLYLNNGNLKISSAANLGSSSNLIAFNGGTLSSLNDLVVPNFISIGSGTGAVAVSGTTTASRTGATFGGVGRMTLSGNIGGNGPLNKIDSNTLTINGDNTYSGGTFISTGTVELGSNTALGSGTITITGGGLRASGAARTLTNALSLGGSFTLGRSTTLSGNAVLTSDITITSANPDSSAAATSTLGGVISGAHSLTFAIGSNPIGNILVSGNNTYTGGTTISGGTITLGNRNALGATGTITVPSGVTLDASSYGVDIGRLSGTGTVTSTGRYTDNVTPGFNYNSSLGYTYRSAANATVSTALTGTATLFKSGTGNLTLTGANTYSGGTRITNESEIGTDPGTITMGNASALGTGPVIMELGSTLDASTYGFDLGRLSGLGTLTSSGSYTYNSASDRGIGVKLAGSASLVKSGTGNLILTSSLTYTGGTTISAGTLSLSQDCFFYIYPATPSFNVAAGATLNLSGYQFDFELSNTSGSGTIIAPGNGSDRLIYNGGTKTISADLIGSGIFAMNSGVLTLTGNNAFSSVTIVSSTLIMGSANAIGTGQITIPGGTLDTASYGIDLARIIANGTVATSGVFTYNSSSDATQSTTALTGTGSLVKSGTGNLTLSGPTRTSTYSGGTTINGGKITMGSASAVGTGPVTLASGTTLDISTFGFDIGRLSGSGTLTSSSGGVYSYSSASDVTFSMPLGGGASLSKGGSGNLTLTAGNGYSGGTNISGGTLTMGNSGALGSGSVTVGSGATLNASTYGFNLARLSGTGTVTTSGGYSYNSSSNFSVPTVLAGNSTLTKSGTGNLTLSGANTYSGATTISAGTVTLGNAAALSSGAVTLAAGATINAAAFGFDLGRFSSDTASTLTSSGGVYTYSSVSDRALGMVLSGGASLSKGGTGNLTLSGANTYTGTTTISAGRITMGSASAISTGAVNVLPGATLDAGTYGFDLTRLSGSGTITTSGGYSYNSSVGASVSAVLSGSGTLVKSGTGNLTLTGASTYTGATTISGGTLVVDGSLAGATTIGSGGTLGGHGNVGTVAIASGGKISPGNSPGLMNTGSETWSGGGSYVWEINNAAGTQGATSGTGWDSLNIGGSLALNNSAGNPFTIYVTSLTTGNLAGFATGFVPGRTYSFTIATATTPLTGFGANKFIVNTSSFQNDSDNLGGWSLVLSSDSLRLNLTYTAIPEPGQWGAIMGVSLLALAFRRRRFTTSVACAKNHD